jgi:hypothetical protein
MLLVVGYMGYKLKYCDVLVSRHGDWIDNWIYLTAITRTYK